MEKALDKGNIKKYLRLGLTFPQSLLGKLKPSKHPFILAYHRVLNDLSELLFPIEPGMYVTKKTFEMHLEYLSCTYEILPLSVLLDKFFNGGNTEYCCAITFDDGWKDNFLHAFPVLKKYNVVASFFLATGYIGTNNWFWSEEIAYFLHNSDILLQNKLIKPNTLPNEIKDCFYNLNRNFGENLTKIVWFLKGINKDNRESIIEEIRNYNRRSISGKTFMMNWAQVKEMHLSGLASFYPHSVNHEVLTYLDNKELESEISTSIDMLHNYLGDIKTNIFCYPSGGKNDKLITIFEKYNINYALIIAKGKLTDSKDRYSINRIGLHDKNSSKKALLKYRLR